MIRSIAAAALGLALFSAPAFADDAKYSTSKTPINELMEDDAAMAILQAEIPDVVNNDQIGMAFGMTLVDISAYAPDMLTKEKLTSIDEQLAHIE